MVGASWSIKSRFFVFFLKGTLGDNSVKSPSVISTKYNRLVCRVLECWTWSILDSCTQRPSILRSSYFAALWKGSKSYLNLFSIVLSCWGRGGTCGSFHLWFQNNLKRFWTVAVQHNFATCVGRGRELAGAAEFRALDPCWLCFGVVTAMIHASC